MYKSIATVFMVAASAACAAGAADAPAADPMSAYYGNTWEYKDSEGVKLLQLDANGSFQVLHFNGRTYRGQWDINGRSVCFRINADVACFDDIAGRKLGEQWTGPHDGETYSGRLHAGRQPLEERP